MCVYINDNIQENINYLCQLLNPLSKKSTYKIEKMQIQIKIIKHKYEIWSIFFFHCIVGVISLSSDCAG